MPYIGAGIQRFNTADGLTVNGNAEVTGTTALTGNATAAGTLDVTGAITSSDGATITTADNDPQITLVSTDTDSTGGPELKMYRNSASPADNDFTGIITFHGENDAGEEIEYSRIRTRIVDATDGSEDSRIEFEGHKDGSSIAFCKMDSSNTVFNEDSQSIDFRVESNGNVNMLFVDASADRIGIGTDSPSDVLDVNGDIRVNNAIESPNNLNLEAENGLMRFSTGSGSPSERMQITSGGKVLMGSTSAPNQACEVFIDDTLMIGRGDQNITGSLSTSGLIINAQSGSFIMTLYDDNDTANPRLTLNRNGNLTVSGALSKGSGSFRIDHPLPAKSSTHDLVHSFIEGPQADLIYRGKVDLVAGSATVNIDTAAGMTDGTFVLLCGDVQCFTSNEDGFTAVKGSVSDNTLTITAEADTCTDTISWMVVGERKDQHMIDTTWTDDNGKVIVEPLKGSQEVSEEE